MRKITGAASSQIGRSVIIPVLSQGDPRKERGFGRGKTAKPVGFVDPALTVERFGPRIGAGPKPDGPTQNQRGA